MNDTIDENSLECKYANSWLSNILYNVSATLLIICYKKTGLFISSSLKLHVVSGFSRIMYLVYTPFLSCFDGAETSYIRSSPLFILSNISASIGPRFSYFSCLNNRLYVRLKNGYTKWLTPQVSTCGKY